MSMWCLVTLLTLISFFGMAQAAVNEWSYVGLAPEAIRDIVVRPDQPNTMYAVSRDFFRTTDHGLTWDTINIVQRQLMNDLELDPARPDTIWVAARQEGIYRSSDGGQSWEPRNHGLSLGGDNWCSIFSIALNPANPNRMLCAMKSDYASLGTIYCTTDGGLNWTSVFDHWSTRALAFSKVSFDPQDPSRAYAMSFFYGQLYQSSDSGATFQLLTGLPEQYSTDSTGLLSDFSFDPFHPSSLWCVSMDSLFFTTDRGLSWTVVQSAPLSDQYGMYVFVSPVREGEIFITTTTSVFRSTDSGETWQRLERGWPQTPAIEGATSLIQASPTELWVARSSEGIWTYTAEDSLSVTPGHSLSPYPSSLSLSAFPNPFNSTTRIRFDLVKQERVKLDLFDLEGRHIKTLVDDVRNAGRQEIAFDGKGLASGTYFVRLKTAENARTEKILLLK